jgi:chromosome segregation ATPase
MDRSTEDEQQVMKNTLNELNINYNTEEEENSSSVDNIDVTTDDDAAEDIGANIIEELQQALQRQRELEEQVKTLQESLSVCYTKESRYSARLTNANSKVAAQETENKLLKEQVEALTSENQTLTEGNEQLGVKVRLLTESLKDTKKTNDELTASLSGYRESYSAMQKKLEESKSKKTTLDESLNSKTAKVKELTEAYSQLKESSDKKLQEALTVKNELEAKNNKLVEELQEAKKDSQIIKSQSNAKLEKAQQLVEKYKSVAKTAVDKYIATQATRIGVAPSDIKSRLTESYSFKDIDKAVEDVQQYKLNINSLPFSTMSEKKSVKMKIRESKEPLLDIRDKTSYNFDDDVDDTLLTFTN